MEKKQFQAESKRLLDMMIHSIYTHKEIFLRELISNASDAIDKRCYQSLTDSSVTVAREDFGIELRVDAEHRILTIADNGIGMNQEELENNLGVIASSGSYRFRQELGEDKPEDVDIIGQFGVGFYSAFMVADHITVATLRQGETQGFVWQSDGAEGYTIAPCEKETVGTEIALHLREDADGENYSQYLEEFTLQQLVKKYSDYIRWPIRMELTRSRAVEVGEGEKPQYEQYKEETVLNSRVPLWQKKKSEVTKEEYDSFYMEKFGDFTPPMSVVTASVEGAVTYKALLFIPGKTPYDFYSREYEAGLQLYSSGVLIMDKCADLLPDHFRFVRGVVDTPDVSLNISRELLQHDRQLKVIANSLEKKLRSELSRMMQDEPEKYAPFFANFGRQLKYGVVANYGAKKEDLQDLLLFYSSTEKKPVSLKDYVSRMSEEQPYIYYASGESVAALDKLPQMELLQERGWEVLYLTEEVDEFVMQILHRYQEKELRSAIDGDLGIESESAEENAGAEDVLRFVKQTLGEAVKDVRLSQKLRSHPVCLRAGEGLSFEMEKYFKAVQPDSGMKAERILELNAAHSAYQALEAAFNAGETEKAEKYARLLYAQALLIAGLPLEDPSTYTDLVCSLMV